MRVYFKGVEIDQIPELKEVCAMDDWMDGLLKWVKENHPEVVEFDAITSVESVSAENPNILEIWVGGAPPMRAMEIGGVLQSFSVLVEEEEK